MTEEEARQELEEITIQLVKLQNKKSRTNIVEKNKEYKEICYDIYCKEQRKEFLLNLINKNYAKKEPSTR